MVQGYCFDSWFDWGTQSGHYDARVARTCRNMNSEYGDRITDSGRTFTGMKKAGYCYGQNDQTCATFFGNASGATVSLSTVDENLPNYTTRAWVRLSNGSETTYSGGSPTSSTS